MSTPTSLQRPASWHGPLGTLLAALAGAALLAGCGEEFDPASQLANLRVLAVQKSVPYARPGEHVDLSLLWHDSEPGRPVPQIAWVALCENPPGDLFEACFSQVPSAEDLATRVSLPDPNATTPNDHFGFDTSPSIISSRPPPADPDTTPYGLSYVFFAACAGQLTVDMGSRIPFACYEELDGVAGFSAGDERKDSRDFIIGYTQVFAYDQLRNQNPRVTGIDFGGLTYWPDSPELAEAAPPGAVLAPARDVCVGSSCTSPPPPSDGAPCLDGLSVDACLDEDECDGTPIELRVDPASAEPDEAASGRSTTALGEQMWVNYYSSAGELDEEVRLLNDAVVGFSDDVATDYQAPDQSGEAYLWAVAHDNRGGAEWARLRICVR